MSGPYTQKSTASAANPVPHHNQRWVGGGSATRAGSRFLVFMIPEVLQVVFEDGQALREGDVVVAQVRNDDREAEQHDQHGAAGGQEKRQRGIRQSDQVAKPVEQRVHQRENQHGGGGQQPGHGILHANVRPAHAEQNGDEQDDADNCGDVQEAVHLSSSAAAAWPAVKAAIEFQYVDKNSKQHVHHVVEGLESGDGRSAGGAGAHVAGHLFEAEAAALQDDECLNFRVFQWETLAEDLQGAAVDADETGGGIAHGLAEDGPQHEAKEADTEGADNAGSGTVVFGETGADHHVAAGGLEGLENAENVAGVVLPIAIHADYI